MEKAELLQGTLQMLILKTLMHEPMHGYAIAESLLRNSDGVLCVEEGALYPALHRLEVRGLLSSRWGLSSNNRRAKYYQLTAAGRQSLEEESLYWTRLSGAVTLIMEGA